MKTENTQTFPGKTESELQARIDLVESIKKHTNCDAHFEDEDIVIKPETATRGFFTKLLAALADFPRYTFLVSRDIEIRLFKM